MEDNKYTIEKYWNILLIVIMSLFWLVVIWSKSNNVPNVNDFKWPIHLFGVDISLIIIFFYFLSFAGWILSAYISIRIDTVDYLDQPFPFKYLFHIVFLSIFGFSLTVWNINFERNIGSSIQFAMLLFISFLLILWLILDKTKKQISFKSILHYAIENDTNNLSRKCQRRPNNPQ